MPRLTWGDGDGCVDGGLLCLAKGCCVPSRVRGCCLLSHRGDALRRNGNATIEMDEINQLGAFRL